MHCSTCGSRVPAGRDICDTCGSWIEMNAPAELPSQAGPGGRSPFAVRAMGSCPRCRYTGEGVSYFSRGAHMLALIGATLFTLPMVMGAGGLVYFWARHDHRICPRCGAGWGKDGVLALDRPALEPVPSAVGRYRAVPAAMRGAGVKRPWSIMLLTLGAILLTVGAFELAPIAAAFGVLATAGGVALHVQANTEREERRAALLAALQLPVLQLAAERGGRLTVTEVAAALSWPMRRAEKVLHSLDDGWRVESDVTDEGLIVYEFREILLGPGHNTDNADLDA